MEQQHNYGWLMVIDNWDFCLIDVYLIIPCIHSFLQDFICFLIREEVIILNQLILEAAALLTYSY